MELYLELLCYSVGNGYRAGSKLLMLIVGRTNPGKGVRICQPRQPLSEAQDKAILQSRGGGNGFPTASYNAYCSLLQESQQFNEYVGSGRTQ